MKVLKSHKCFDGQIQFWEHSSQETKTTMKFSTFIPKQPPNGCLIWLSGLGCTDENFITKGGAPKFLAQENLMILCPDTSPRGLNLPGERGTEYFGVGAGFYVDATTPGFADHYRMYSYVTEELYSIVENHFGQKDRISIFGHSMGGHGALIMGLRNPKKFKSVSAFAPLTNPSSSPWEHAFRGYMGNDRSAHKNYDATELVLSGLTRTQEILIDQGSSDAFLEKAANHRQFLDACKNRQPLNLRIQEGYDHGYYFISTFIEDHIRFYANALSPQKVRILTD